MAATTSGAIGTVERGQVERVDFGRLRWVAPLAALVAIVVNLALYAIGRASGAMPDSVLIPANNAPLPAGAVVVMSLAGIVGAAIVYALLGRFTRRPIRIFLIVSVAVFILTLASPFSIPGAGAAYRAILLLMHVVVAAAAVGFFTRLARRS